MTKTKIEWADRVWNPVTGCSKVSEGCRNCYAERLAKRFWGERKFEDVQCHEDRWDQPLSWRKPARVFANSMSDLFHEDVPIDTIANIFAVMRLAEQHIFVVLTKRAERMQAVLTNSEFGMEYRDCIDVFTGGGLTGFDQPLPNVWLGVSIENQKTADERIPLLLGTPAAKRVVSYEPALGPVDLRSYFNSFQPMPWPTKAYPIIHWVIMGGESGPNARPMHPDWARTMRNQCQAAGVKFFFKQWGEWVLTDSRLEVQRLVNGQKERRLTSIKIPGAITYNDEWFRWVGKRSAGRQLDGREWNEYPDCE